MGKGCFCIFTFLEPWGLWPTWACFCVLWGWRERLEGGWGWGGPEERCPPLSFRRASHPSPHRPPDPRVTPGTRGLSQPIPGILRTFQACNGRFGDFSPIKPTVL